MAWHEEPLSHVSGGAGTLSVTWPPLSSGQHNVWLIAALKNSTFGAHEKDETSTAAYFLTIKALQRKKRKAQTPESYPHEYLAGFFFFLYPPVDSLSDSYKTHPSLMSVCLSLYWLEISSPLIDLEKQTKSFLQISWVMRSTLSKSWFFFLSQRRGEINGKSGDKKKKREDAQTLFPEIPSAKLTSPEDSAVEKAD